jgi:hypothetical protein
LAKTCTNYSIRKRRFMSVYAVSISFIKAVASTSLSVRSFTWREFAGAFQQPLRIDKFGTTKEPDVDVSPEGIDIAECGVTYTRSRMAVVQYLSNVVTAVAHDLKPTMSDCT